MAGVDALLMTISLLLLRKLSAVVAVPLVAVERGVSQVVHLAYLSALCMVHIWHAHSPGRRTYFFRSKYTRNAVNL
jgi:hypothetical protein